jgi:hypothetical protein
MSAIDVDDFVKPPPKAGSGVHPWLFGQACRLKGYGATPEETLKYIIASLDKHPPGRVVDERELNEAVRNAFAEEGERANGPSWHKPKARHIKAIVEKSGALTLDKLKNRCPADLENRKAEKVIDTLFPGNPLLCLAASKSQARTLEREQWRGREKNLQFIVPSPMTATFGRAQNGSISARCLDNVGERRFLVVEFDMTPYSEFWRPCFKGGKRRDSLVYYLLHEHQIKKTLRHERFGIKAYHHPKVLEALLEAAPETQLLQEIDKAELPYKRIKKGIWEWVGSSSTLQEILEIVAERKGFSARARLNSLLRYGNTCGTYLTRLSKKMPDCVTKRRGDTGVVYHTRPPVGWESPCVHKDVITGVENAIYRKIGADMVAASPETQR